MRQVHSKVLTALDLHALQTVGGDINVRAAPFARPRAEPPVRWRVPMRATAAKPSLPRGVRRAQERPRGTPSARDLARPRAYHAEPPVSWCVVILRQLVQVAEQLVFPALTTVSDINVRAAPLPGGARRITSAAARIARATPSLR